MKAKKLILIVGIILVLVSSFTLGLVTTSGSSQVIGSYTYVTFYGNGTFNTTDALSDVSILTIGGGGGGGGSYYAGGGGGGGLKFNSSISLSSGNYVITVGAGGAGGANSQNGSIGSSSSVSGIVTALGGGGGASSVVGAGTSAPNGTQANGGGASANGGVGGVTTDGGFQGGNSTTGSTGAGGGAGCNGLGSNGVATSKGGNGGIGINLTSYFPALNNTELCGGGGGSASDSVQWGYGQYGGGNGTKDNSGTPADATSGINGTGGGGGGTSRLGTKKGGNGGSGIIIIKYALPIPSVFFYSQVPSNVTTTSIFTQNLNITYNYSIVNLTSPQLNYTITGLSCIESINGTCVLANNTPIVITQTSNATTDNRSLISYTLGENMVYPYVANLNSSYFNATHNSYSYSVATNAASIGFINMTTENSYNILEVMSISTGQLRVYACNSSYSFSTSLLSDVNCQEIGNINTNTYNHTHGAYSNHSIVPYTIINGKIGGSGITVTNNMSFLFKHVSGTSQVFYVSNFSRTNAVRTTGNNGVTWTADNTVTVDSHVHQYPISGVFINYKGQGTFAGTTDYTAINTTQIQITQMQPQPPIITIPTPGGYNQSTRFMNITWNNATVFINTTTISKYNITLLNSDGSYNRTINNNSGLNNSYYWNVYDENLSLGEYYVRVYVFDSIGGTNFDQESFNLTKNAFLNLSITDVNGTLIPTNVTINLTNQNLSSKEIFTATNGSFSIDVIKGTNYTLDIDAQGYANTQYNFSTNSSINQSKTFSIVTQNSITFNIYDLATSLPILQTSTILLVQGNTSLSYTTTTGTKYVDNIPEGIYSITISSSNYSNAFFTVTMTNKTTQTVNAYLSNAFSNIGFYTKSNGGDPLYLTDIIVQQSINGSYVTVANKKSDVLGFALFQLTDGTQYKFIMTPTGDAFQSKTFLMETYVANSPYTIQFITGGLAYYTSFDTLAGYKILPNATILENKSQTFSIASFSINGTILYTYVNCTDGTTSDANNVSGFPNGATAQITKDLSNFHGRYTCTFILSVDTLSPRIITIPYYISGNVAYNNTNLVEASNVFKNEIENLPSGSGQAWKAMLAIFLILVAAITAHQLSSGMSKISTVTALAGVIVFGFLGWLPAAISFFIVLIGGFLVFYREAY